MKSRELKQDYCLFVFFFFLSFLLLANSLKFQVEIALVWHCQMGQVLRAAMLLCPRSVADAFSLGLRVEVLALCGVGCV